MITLPKFNMPYPLPHIILATLRNPLATPDHALVLADAIDELAASLPPASHFLDSCRQAANAVRDYAPALLKPQAPADEPS